MWIKAHNNGARLSRYTYRCAVLPDRVRHPACHCAGFGLNAPTGAWCSLTINIGLVVGAVLRSQCTYRCGVLPDSAELDLHWTTPEVSMHLQVRGAP